MSLSCFKAYDIRGRIPDDIDENIAWCIGRAYAEEVKPKIVVVGYDVRLESPLLAQALMCGLNDGGVGVINIGMCGTEEVYFHTFHRQAQGVGGGIMITASHNPKGYNGMKLVRQGARPISGDSGLLNIRDRVAALVHSRVKSRDKDKGEKNHPQITSDTDKSHYIAHLLNYVDSAGTKPLKIVANPGNGAAGPVMRLLKEHLPFEIILIQDQPDGNFPSGVPNPLLPENRAITSSAVIENNADFGIAWDGDFDRCFLFDSQGRFIEGYYLVGLLAQVLLAEHPGSKIIHDPRLTWNTIDLVKQAGGVPIQSKTGHAFIKERMRQEDAIYGGEMSSHHYFRDFGYCDSGMIPWLLIAELISRTGKSLADLVDARMDAYPCSGEINYHVESPSGTTGCVLAYIQNPPLVGSGVQEVPLIDHTDGISVEFADWRFNLRGSNTEPLLRLNVETRADAPSLNMRVSEIEAIIKKCCEAARIDGIPA